MGNSHHASWIAALLPACFHPSYDRPACGPHSECPGDLTCNQGFCELADAPGSQIPGGGFLDGGSHDSGSPDAVSDVPLLCFGAYPTVCFSSIADVPTAPLILMGDIDTMTSALCNTHNNQGDFCVVSGAGITIPTGKTIRAFGARPLVLLSTTTFDLSGSLDVSSTSAPGALHPTGPGVVTIASCSEFAVAPTASSGGFGGSFGGKGGNGHPQDTTAVPTSGSAVLFPAKLRAGCPGSSGSTVSSGVTPGAGGKGGGAVSVIASEIQLNGQINASGAFGVAGGAVKAGGGGGGSGGMIVLDSPSIVPGQTFALFANGGGGGQGGSSGNGGGAGQNGFESTGPFVAGLGGNNGTTQGGSGGSGAFGTAKKDGANASSDNLSGNAGGGAGGGGAGFIAAHGITTNIAPASTPP